MTGRLCHSRGTYPTKRLSQEGKHTIVTWRLVVEKKKSTSRGECGTGGKMQVKRHPAAGWGNSPGETAEDEETVTVTLPKDGEIVTGRLPKDGKIVTG